MLREVYLTVRYTGLYTKALDPKDLNADKNQFVMLTRNVFGKLSDSYGVMKNILHLRLRLLQLGQRKFSVKLGWAIKFLIEFLISETK